MWQGNFENSTTGMATEFFSCLYFCVLLMPLGNEDFSRFYSIYWTLRGFVSTIEFINNNSPIILTLNWIFLTILFIVVFI